MNYVALDRRFRSWDEEEGSALNRNSTPWHDAGGVPWGELRKRKRVVLLAEAGSGKSAELKEQARLVSAEGGYGFYTEVKVVAREGLDESLGASGRARFTAWKTCTEPGFFYVDAVDEAKLDRIRLGEAHHGLGIPRGSHTGCRAPSGAAAACTAGSSRGTFRPAAGVAR